MARERSRTRAYIPWWLWAIVLISGLWYGLRYYQSVREGTLSPALPVRVSPGTSLAVRGKDIAIVSGHLGYDSGALCENGLAEVDVVRTIVDQLARLLRNAGARVIVLKEKDPRLQGLRADVLVSVHADSCIEASGFKVARWRKSPHPRRDDRLVECLTREYASLTGLTFVRLHITEDMTDYHVFSKISGDTPAAIIETGYLGGDRPLLTRKSHLVALGIAEGIGCFFKEEPQ